MYYRKRRKRSKPDGPRYLKNTYDCKRTGCGRKHKPRKLYRWLAERRHNKLIRWEKRHPVRAALANGMRWKTRSLPLNLCNECGRYPSGWFGTGKCKDCARRYARRLERKRLALNPELRQAKMDKLAEWKREHVGRTKAYNRMKNRERWDLLDGNDLTGDEWRAILEAFDFTCVYCGERGGSKQKDHVIPFSKGGKFTLPNIVPACGPCNLERSDTDFREWVNDERKYDAILQTLGDLEYALA